ncbi:hypothetical protein BH24ACT22_BH24ACT22_01800 [soil metagenome]
MKKLVLIITVLAMTIGVAAPALAQVADDQYSPGTGESVSATGVVERPEATTYMYGTHALIDETSGAQYALQSDVVDLNLYTGERVTASGTLVPGYENGQIEGGPPLVDVTRVEPVGESGASSEYTRTGSIIGVNENGIFVSEDPTLGVEDDGYCEKTYEFLFDGDTEILRQQNGELVPARADELETGQSVEVTYTETPGDVIPAICPTPRTADKIVILGENPEVPREDPPDDSPNEPSNPSDEDSGNGGEDGKESEDDLTLLPDTGGISLPIAGAAALMIAGGLLARRLSG